MAPAHNPCRNIYMINETTKKYRTHQKNQINRKKCTYQKKGSDRLVGPAVLFKEVTYDDTSTKESKEDTEGDNSAGRKKG